MFCYFEIYIYIYETKLAYHATFIYKLRDMVFNATFNNFSVISWQLVLLQIERVLSFIHCYLKLQFRKY